jgi:hypothetical protein
MPGSPRHSQHFHPHARRFLLFPLYRGAVSRRCIAALYFYGAPGWRSKRSGGANDRLRRSCAPPSRTGGKGPTFPAVKRHEAHLSREPSKEACLEPAPPAWTGPPGDRGALHCHRNATNRSRSVSSARILPVVEEQSRTRGGQSGGVTDQPQCRGLWHSSRPSARSFTRSPSSPPSSFTQSPFPPRSIVRDWQTSPHRPRLVVSQSRCPPLSPSPHANSFVIGTAVINTHTPG